MNLDAVLQIAARVTGIKQVENLGRAIQEADKAATGAKQAFKGVASSSTWQAAAVGAAAIGGALALSTNAAITFESSVADVRKVVDGINTPAGLAAIRQEIIGLSREMPIAAEGFAQIYAAAGQAGIPRAEIRAFAIDVARMATAFDMTAEDAGNSLAKMRSSLGLNQRQVVDLADALNYLSNGTASTGAELTNFTLRSGAAGQVVGLSAEKTAAFGAAMVGAGIEVEVASTSFNNMIKALSRGASMTDRQTKALQRLGLASSAVKDGERKLTEEVERQGELRLQAIQDESDRQLAELRKRYRRQLQLLEDQWDDEEQLNDERISDQTDAQVKALQRQGEERIRLIQRQYGDNAEAADAQAQLVRDQVDREVDALRDGADRQLRLQRRAARDRQQAVRDQMDEEMAARVQAQQRQTEAVRREEQASITVAVETAKKTAAASGSTAGETLARNLQKNALGTILDVFQRIKNLPKDMQLSVISDLFGDEARGLTPLIQNTQSLTTALGLVGDKTKYAGSMLKEYEARSQTTANAIQLAQNNFTALQIELGSKVVPVLGRLLGVVTPLLNVFLAMPGWLQTTVVGVAGLGAVAVVALPGLAAFLQVVAQLGGAAKVMSVAMAVATGPVGIAIGIVVALGAAFVLAYQRLDWFRNAVNQWFEGWKAYWVGSFQVFTGAWNVFLGILLNDQTRIDQGWRAMIEGMRTAWNGAVTMFRAFFGNFVTWLGNRFNNEMRYIGNNWGNILAGALANALSRGLANSPVAMALRFATPRVPRFAEGGFVSGPTMGLVGEAGPEYVIPARKMAAASAAFLGGARGADVLAGARGGTGTGGVSVTITTGPVMQQGGDRYVTLDQAQQMVREGVGAVFRQLRTPAGRYATGVA